MKAHIKHIREIVESEPNDMLMGQMIRKYFNKVDTPEIIKCVVCEIEVTENTKSHLYVEPVCAHCASKLHQSRQDYNSFMNQYKKDHALCPKCKHTGYMSTLVGYTYSAEHKDQYKDMNACTCSSCGDRHTMHERVSL